MNQNNKACTLNSCMNQNEIYFWRERECVFCGVSPFYSTIKLEKKTSQLFKHKNMDNFT